MVYLDLIEKLAKIIGVCIAAFGVWKYTADLRQERIDRTIEYFEEYNDATVRNSREYVAALAVSWKDSKLAVSEVENKINSDLLSLEGRKNSDIILEYFNKVFLCVKVGQCDETIASTLLKEEAVSLTVLLYPYIKHFRQFHPKFAQGLVCISGNSREDCTLGYGVGK